MTIEDMTTYQREWYTKKRKRNPTYAEQRRQYRLANYDRVREQERASRAKNIDKHRVDSRERMQKMRAERPEHVARLRKRADLKRKYRMTPEQRAELFALQGNCCAVCKSQDPVSRDWHTDHCHSTGRVRGILCQPCNLMLGHAKDSPERLRAGAEYLTTTYPVR